MAISPLHVVIANAVVFGGLATIFTVISVSTTAWQEYTWTYSVLQSLNNTDNWQVFEPFPSAGYYTVKKKITSPVNDTEVTRWVEQLHLYNSYTGVWQICDTLSDDARKSIGKQSECFSFVTEYDEEQTPFEEHGKWLARMHNSAASCFIVSLIDLVAAIVIGAIGLSQRQVSVCMVTGVLYILSALFSVFGLGIFHSKDYNEKYECYALNEIPEELCPARTVTVLWSLPLGWTGVSFSLVAAVIWLFLARALRVIKAKTMNI